MGKGILTSTKCGEICTSGSPLGIQCNELEGGQESNNWRHCMPIRPRWAQVLLLGTRRLVAIRALITLGTDFSIFMLKYEITVFSNTYATLKFPILYRTYWITNLFKVIRLIPWEMTEVEAYKKIHYLLKKKYIRVSIVENAL